MNEVETKDQEQDEILYEMPLHRCPNCGNWELRFNGSCFVCTACLWEKYDV